MQNSIILKKPKDSNAFQLIKDDKHLYINYLADGTIKQEGTVNIGAALVLQPLPDFPNQPVNGMLAMVDEGGGTYGLFCYLNDTWVQVSMK